MNRSKVTRVSRVYYFVWSAACFLICSGFQAHAQNAQRIFESAKKTGDVLEVQTNQGMYRIRAYSEEVLETSFIPKSDTGLSSPVNVTSHALVMKPQNVATNLKITPKNLTYSTQGMSLEIIKSPFQLRYWYRGKFLISEKLGYEKIANGESLSFNLDATEALYGAGARALGMNRRGHKLPLYNKAHYGYEDYSEQMNFSIPLVYSSNMYGIHFDNAAIGTLDFDSQHDNTLRYETISGRKIYQVIAGENWEKLVANYVNLTGKQPLPPRWAFGNFASRFGYHSEVEARAVIAQYRAEQIPLDAIIFDLYWFGKEIKGTMGNLAFDRDNFPDQQQMIADFAQKNVKTILITEPFILTTSKRWQEAVDQNILATDKNGKAFAYDFYFGNTGLIDVFKPQARDWFWTIYKNLAQAGVAGVWGDLGEPEVHPAELQHVNGSADQVHNIYGHEWAKLIAEGYQKDFPQQRPFILMRAGYSGSQRFGLIPWSGDVNRTWGGLRSQPEIALQMGMQGLAYMHSDLGGFAGANLDDELYTRWLQYGVFQPIFRPHAQEEVPAEAIFRSGKAKALAKAAIELRYQLLPYNYTLAFENSQTGLPLMRPLFFAEPDNPEFLNDASAYFWGRDFLVHPILQAGQQNADIRFPKNSVWFDFYSGQRFEAGSKASVNVDDEHIPTYVRAGAFIPMMQDKLKMQSTEEYRGEAVSLHYFHDSSVAESAGQLYEDDGKNAQAFETGAYRLLKMRSQFKITKAEHILKLDLVQQGGDQETSIRSLQLQVHQLANRPLKVLRNDTEIDFVWNEKTKIMQVDFQQNRQEHWQIIWARPDSISKN